MNRTTSQRKFKVADNYAPFIGKKLSSVIQNAVNASTKDDHIIHLDDFDDGNLFAVRAGKFYNELVSEEEEHLVSHTGFVELSSDDEDKKKVRFALWKRIKSSKILR